MLLSFVAASLLASISFLLLFSSTKKKKKKKSLCHTLCANESHIIVLLSSSSSVFFSFFFRRYELPDGQVITVDSETRFGVAETLFQPTLFASAKANNVNTGIIDLILDSISKCDGDLQPDLFGNIVLSGGSSMFPGLRKRVLNEITSRVSEDVEVNVITDSQRKHAAWIGGSMFGSLGTFGDIQYTRQEYNEGGATTIHRKCF